MTKHEEREYFFRLVFLLDFHEKDDMAEQLDLFRRLQMASEQETFEVIKEKALKLKLELNMLKTMNYFCIR